MLGTIKKCRGQKKKHCYATMVHPHFEVFVQIWFFHRPSKLVTGNGPKKGSKVDEREGAAFLRQLTSLFRRENLGIKGKLRSV